MSIQTRLEAIGNLSNTSKMPCRSHGIPASECIMGSRLADNPNTTCHHCYAKTGMYAMSNVDLANYNRFDIVARALELKSYYDKYVDDFATILNTLSAKSNKTWGDTNYFRWFDTGDLQSVNHLRLINDICLKSPQVIHWLPTKEIGMLTGWVGMNVPKAPNLQIKASTYLINGPISTFHKILAEKSEKTGQTISFSSTHTGKTHPDPRFEICNAHNTNNQCQDCRKCWSLTNISYPLRTTAKKKKTISTSKMCSSKETLKSQTNNSGLPKASYANTTVTFSQTPSPSS